ncbi:MAG: hypothetical protein K1X57_22435 [Gemmataceae bacterium]|nr:hypothetical protein [Gemmataceae bacterium]
MSDESVLDRVMSRKAEDPAIDDGPLDLGCFGWLRGVRDRAIMLEFRHKDGRVTSFGYAWLKKVTFDPSEGITLDFSGETVKITGLNLDAELRPRVRLVSGLVRQRVTWVQEADGQQLMNASPNDVVVERLVVK